MNAMHFLVTTVFDLYLMVVILRFWLQLARADFYNPFSQFVVKATQPVIAPMRRVLPSIGVIDTASIALALIVVMVKFLALTLIVEFKIDAVSLIILSVVSVIKEAGVLLFWVLIIRALLSWFNQGHNPIVMVMDQLNRAHFYALFAKSYRQMGGLDLSVMLVLIAMNFINILFAQYIPFWNAV